MTNAIEQTKREMYEHWKSVSKLPVGIAAGAVLLGFEAAFEAHLEELRKALVAGNAVIVECAQHSAESYVELERRLADMKNERDAIQLRLHAVDHAYKTQQDQIATRMQESGDRGASEHPDPYKLGYESLGKCANPFPVNTIERLHWENGAADARGRLGQSASRQVEGMRSGPLGWGGF